MHGIANCNINANFSLNVRVETAEIMENSPRKIVIFDQKTAIILHFKVRWPTRGEALAGKHDRAGRRRALRLDAARAAAAAA